jgi:hypothetical protein
VERPGYNTDRGSCFVHIRKSASLIGVKRAQKCFLVGLLVAVPIAVQPQTTITNRPALTDRGHVEDLTYSNATLGFTYKLPQGFFVNPLPGHLPPGSLLLVIADKHNGTPWRDRILLVADDAEEYSWTTSEYVTHFVRSMPARLHVVLLRQTYLLKIAGQDFFRTDFQKTDEGNTVYQAFVATRLKGSLVSWTFTSLNNKEVGEMAASVNTVAFTPASTKAR